MEYIFHGRSKRYIKTGNISSIRLRSHCACWRVGTRLFSRPHDVIWLEKTACSKNISHLLVFWRESPWGFHPSSFNHVSVQRRFHFRSQCLQKETNSCKWSSALWKRILQIQCVSIQSCYLAGTRNNYNVKRQAAITKHLGTGALSASASRSSLFRSSVTANRATATANVNVSLVHIGPEIVV